MIHLEDVVVTHHIFTFLKQATNTRQNLRQHHIKIDKNATSIDQCIHGVRLDIKKMITNYEMFKKQKSSMNIFITFSL